VADLARFDAETSELALAAATEERFSEGATRFHANRRATTITNTTITSKMK
jgi:hypothetical protein